MAIKAVREANSLLDLKGTGLTFYSSNFDGGIVRCETCFEYACENPPGVLNTNLDSSNKQLSLGNTFAVGISVNKEKVEALIAGGNQKWYSFKSMMLDHVGCSTARNGDFSHYKALVAQKQSRKIKNTVQSIVSSQLKGALTVVKVKAASLHYENIIGSLQSCGVNIGNIGHGRKQMNAMLQAFQTYIFKKTRALLQTPLPSTGLPPHFCTASDKSTPARLSNHAIMVLTMVNGEKAAVPLYAPPVYSFQDSHLEGGTARELAKQVIASLCETIKLPATSLSFLVAGQYQAADFRRELIDVIQAGMVPSNKCSEHENFFIVAWDIAHWIDCGFNDIREKEEAGSVLRRLIRRCNKFQSMFARGRGYAEYHGYTLEQDLRAKVTRAYSTTRFTSSAFNQFLSIYSTYEGLAKSFNEMRETDYECEEMRYMIKGRDFCIDLCGIIDILSPLNDVMVKAQSLNQYLWSVTKWWPKVKNMLGDMEKCIENQLLCPKNLALSSRLFPKLSKHFHDLSTPNIKDCTFQNIQLVEGWLVSNSERFEESNSASHLSKKRVVTWICRQMKDCLQEMRSFCKVIVDVVDKRYISSTSDVANTLSCFHIPDILLH